MIKINLLDYRRVTQEIAVQKMVMASVAVIAVSLVLTGLVFVMDSMKVESILEENRIAEQEVNALKGKFNKVKSLKEREKQIQGVIKGIDQLRGNKLPVTQLMEDVSENLPQGLWLDGIQKQDEGMLRKNKVPVLFLELEDDKSKKKKKKKKKKGAEEELAHEFVRISGKSRSERSVVRFMERLEMFDYLDHVILHESKTKWIGFEQVREFVVYAHLSGSGPPPAKPGEGGSAKPAAKAAKKPKKKSGH